MEPDLQEIMKNNLTLQFLTLQLFFYSEFFITRLAIHGRYATSKTDLREAQVDVAHALTKTDINNKYR